MDLAGLFAVALVAATLLPAQSEAVLVALLIAGDRAPLTLLAVATAGNVLGSVINWAIGWQAARFADRRWFPVTAAGMARASGWYRRYGVWTLLGSWLPVIGDPLTVVAGAMKEPLWRFLALVILAKGGRYLAIAWAVALSRQ